MESPVFTMAVDSELHSAWQRLGPASLEWLPRALEEVQARQALNALHALSRCVELGSVAWLVHLDADELFFPGRLHPSGQSSSGPLDVRQHFAALGALGVGCMTYANFEALPEADHQRCDGMGVSTADQQAATEIPFARVSLFKVNPVLLRHAPQPPASPAPASSSASPSATFHYYTNGKSVTRVSPHARPLSVHEWLPGWPEGLLSGWYSGLLQEDGWTGDFVRPFPRSPMATQASEAGQAPMVGREQATRVPGGQLDGDAMSPHMPVILHFACCSSQALWRRRCDGVARYLLHGTLSAPRLFERTCCWDEEETEEQEIERNGAVAVVDVDDTKLQDDGEEEEEMEEEARRRVASLFASEVMLTDADEARRLIEDGICVRIALPPELFQS